MATIEAKVESNGLFFDIGTSLRAEDGFRRSSVFRMEREALPAYEGRGSPVKSDDGLEGVQRNPPERHLPG